MASSPEHEENGVHCSTVIYSLAMCPQRVVGFVFREQRLHFCPEFITNQPFTACHSSTSGIVTIGYLTIPFGIGSKRSGGQESIIKGFYNKINVTGQAVKISVHQSLIERDINKIKENKAEIKWLEEFSELASYKIDELSDKSSKNVWQGLTRLSPSLKDRMLIGGDKNENR